MTDAEVCVVVRGEAERSVAQQAAQDQLHLVLAEVVLLDGNEDLVALFNLLGVLLALRREDQVVRRAGELPDARPASGSDLELEPLVGLAVVVVLDDPLGRDLAGLGIH